MRTIPALIVAAPAALISASAFAAAYLTIPQAQSALFPDADRFVDATVHLSDEQLRRIKSLSGVRQRNSEQLVWRAERNGKLLGWVILDDVIGKHEFITYVAGLTPDGRVRGIEVLIYRETYGGEIREAQWRNHFRDKSLRDRFELDEDIPNITGATLSCRNVMQGVKKLLALHQVALLEMSP
jgi:Na+-translocating ferredoxin:NAD+ oxidoreductase RnfG subunit